MNKQIEEMANDLGGTWVVDLEGNPHDLSEVLMQCDIESISEQLCEMGYRKQTEAEWLRSRSKYGFGQSDCSACGGYVEGYTSYRRCPHCGAKIIGIKEIN